VTSEQGEIPGVRAGHDIEQVAQERHRAEHQVDHGVQDHPGHDHAGNAESRRLRNQPEPDDPGHGVADHGNQADHRVEPDTEPRPGHRHEIVEQAADDREPPLDGLEPGRPIVADDLAPDAADRFAGPVAGRARGSSR
jgi:hypothetical protein